jgi:S-adenosylmethionine uptake transporter
MASLAQPTRISAAFAVAALGIALFSLMDALMKGLSIAIGTYNALLWRTLAGAAMAGLVFMLRRSPWPERAAMRFHLIRGTMGSVMALLFFWGLARVPMAQAIALAFAAPLIALYLAAILLHEKIERGAILASLLGFAGVVVILAGQAEAELGPEAFRGSIAILLSAGLYAWNIILMRQQALLAGPVEIAFFTSLIMVSCFLLGAPFLAAAPPAARCRRYWAPRCSASARCCSSPGPMPAPRRSIWRPPNIPASSGRACSASSSSPSLCARSHSSARS